MLFIGNNFIIQLHIIIINAIPNLETRIYVSLE